jgi:hypothetical protein
LVGEDRLEAIAVVIGEGQLRSGVRTLTPRDQPAALKISRPSTYSAGICASGRSNTAF